MKQFVAISLCLVISGTAFGQKTSVAGKKINPTHKSAIAGTILDMRKQPVAGIKAFIYKKDSIMASGYSDDAGYFETNSTLAGVYNLKLVYPSEKAIIITGVTIKARELTMINIKTAAPAADSSVAYTVLMPAAPVKVASNNKK